MVNGALFSSSSDEWATPQKIFDDLNNAALGINLIQYFNGTTEV